MAWGSGLLADVRPLRESPAFRQLWAGVTLSAIGGALTSFAVILQVWQLTHSSFAVGAIGVAQMVPTLAVGLLGGSLTDAADRRRLVLVTSTALAAVSAALAAQAFAGSRLLWPLYALAALQASLNAINYPARQTFLPSLLPARLVPAGLALDRLSFQIVLTGAPALAGLITGTPQLGLRACYLIDTVTFAAALYGVARLPAMPPHASAARPGPRAVAEGAAFIRRSQPLAGAFLADLNATVFGLPSTRSGSAAAPAPSACSPRRSAWAACSVRACPARCGTSPGTAGPCSPRSPCGARPSPASRWPRAWA